MINREDHDGFLINTSRLKGNEQRLLHVHLEFGGKGARRDDFTPT